MYRRNRSYGSSTYCHGHTFVVQRNVTFGDLRSVCMKLTEHFNQQHNTDQYRIIPESITKGGILWASWPGKGPKEYKSMRLSTDVSWYPFLQSEGGVEVPAHRVVYPAVHMVHNKQQQQRVTTYLKAIDGAPVWTYEELDVFARELASSGLLLDGPRKRLPSVCSLT